MELEKAIKNLEEYIKNLVKNIQIDLDQSQNKK